MFVIRKYSEQASINDIEKSLMGLTNQNDQSIESIAKLLSEEIFVSDNVSQEEIVEILQVMSEKVNLEDIFKNIESLRQLYNQFAEESLNDFIYMNLSSALESAKSSDDSIVSKMALIIEDMLGVQSSVEPKDIIEDSEDPDMLVSEAYRNNALVKNAGFWSSIGSYLNNILNPFKVWSNVTTIYNGLMSDAPKWKKVLAIFLSALAIGGIGVNQLELIPDIIAPFLGPFAPGVVIDDVNTSIAAVAWIFDKLGLIDISDSEDMPKLEMKDDMETVEASLAQTLVKISNSLDIKGYHELSDECDYLLKEAIAGGPMKTYVIKKVPDPKGVMNKDRNKYTQPLYIKPGKHRLQVFYTPNTGPYLVFVSTDGESFTINGKAAQGSSVGMKVRLRRKPNRPPQVVFIESEKGLNLKVGSSR